MFKPKAPAKRGRPYGNPQTTPESRVEIRRLKALGLKQREIAERMGVSKTVVQRVLWADREQEARDLRLAKHGTTNQEE